MRTSLKIALIFITLFVTSCSITRPTTTQLSTDPAIFMVAHPLSYKTDNGENKIVVPTGFITDLASIPRYLWWWESPHEGTLAPAIIHDYLYWEQSCKKDEADAVMYLAMQEVGLSKFKIEAIYLGVRTPLAQKAWNKNKEAKKHGESRFLTQKYADFILDSQIKPKSTLESIQKDAINNGGILVLQFPNLEVKKACKLALKKFNSQ